MKYSIKKLFAVLAGAFLVSCLSLVYVLGPAIDQWNLKLLQNTKIGNGTLMAFADALTQKIACANLMMHWYAGEFTQGLIVSNGHEVLTFSFENNYEEEDHRIYRGHRATDSVTTSLFWEIDPCSSNYFRTEQDGIYWSEQLHSSLLQRLIEARK
jgi:hypothetical protein